MRVGIDVSAATSQNISGVGYHIIRLIESLLALDAPDLRLDLFFQSIDRADGARAAERFPRDARVRLWPVPFIQSGWYPIHRLYHELWLPAFVRAAGCRIFHGPAHSIPAIPWLPTVVTIHDLAFFRYQLYPPDFTRSLRRLVRASVRRATAVISLSEHTRHDIAALLRRERGVSVIYGAGNYAAARDAAVLAEMKIDRPYILYVGDFGVRKNIPYLLESFAALRKKQSAPDVQLVLAGNSASVRADLEQRMERLGLAQGDAVLAGRVSDAALAALYRRASAFTLCSIMEGFTLVTLEAMSYGVPVVATRTSSIEEGTGEAAELVPLDDPQAVAEAFRTALTPGPRRERMRALGLERYKRFTWARTARETLELYRSLAGRPPAGATRAVAAAGSAP